MHFFILPFISPLVLLTIDIHSQRYKIWRNMYHPPFSISEASRDILASISKQLNIPVDAQKIAPLSIEHLQRTHAAMGFDGRLRECAPAPHWVPVLLTGLLQWHHTTPIHPIIRSAVFIYELLKIAPFSAGNTTVAMHLYATLLSPYLPHTSDTAWTDGQKEALAAENCTQFIHESLRAILETISRTSRKQASRPQKHNQQPAQALAAYIRNHPGCKRQDILAALPELSARMLDRHLQSLREQKIIEYRGSRKTGAYYPAEPTPDF